MAILLDQLSIVEAPVSPRIFIDEFKLRELWCKGIFSDLAYISFALELQSRPTLDILQFSRDWSMEDLSDSQLADGWKTKKLKVRSILNAICILDDRGMADCDFNAQVNQLSLFD
jgi:hypothetical protein